MRCFPLSVDSTPTQPQDPPVAPDYTTAGAPPRPGDRRCAFLPDSPRNRNPGAGAGFLFGYVAAYLFRGCDHPVLVGTLDALGKHGNLLLQGSHSGGLCVVVAAQCLDHAMLFLHLVQQ